ncbi:restriction endonuclease subunit S [Patescibacteria group bacterium]|nr:restriction endonuclease subunit S [Patescibacteria group bacterium]
MIPVDWDVKKLDDIFNISAGRDLVKNDYSEIQDESHKYPIYSNSLENKGLYGYTKAARHKKNCLTITARGTIGRSNKRHTDFDAIGRLLILDPKVKLDGFFISEYLNNKITFSIESTGVPQLTAPQASQYLLVFPEPTEQTAIATVLSDSDVLIENLEKLIAKKRAIKQGAMQQLLTGKKRLPGFSGEWVVKKLGEFGFDISDGNYSSKYPKASEFKERGVPFIRANNIKGLKVVDDDMRFISNQLHSELTKGHLKKDDILITTRGEIGQIAIVPNRHIGSNINAQVVRINAGEKFNKYYFAYFLLKSDTQESLLNMQTGSALKQLPVGKLKELKIVYPPLPEQTAIATVLSDMDAEIEKLEKKLNKYHQIKTGMMQQLLTGNIRLVKI